MSIARNHLQALDYTVLQQCMHCGLCLPTCPTYAETKLERHSPRGRIALMRAIADGDLSLSRTFGEEMYYCLGCLACTSACPAGVRYDELFEAARASVEETHVMESPQRNFWRWLVVRTIFTRPRLLRLIGRIIWLYQKTGFDRGARALKLTHLLPSRLRNLEPMTPRICTYFSDTLIAPVERPVGPLRHRVALLTGCVQDLAFSDINRATVDVLLANSCEVITPRNQPCCGSLHAHNGDLESARQLARRHLSTIDPFTFDAIISNAGGCGSHLRTYGTLLKDDPKFAPRAAEWSRKLRDIHEWLVEINFRPPTNVDDAPAQRITYHESCHLCHGQKISAAPRAILKSIPGLQFQECTEATWCCGSAGIYNITQPVTAGRLQKRKIEHLRATEASLIATANPGCHLQIENAFRAESDHRHRVVHPIVLLAHAYRTACSSEGTNAPSG